MRIPTPLFALFAKRCIAALAVVAAVSATPCPAATNEAPVEFIGALGNQAVSVIRSDMPLASKAAYFRRMIHQDFDLTGICRFVLGPYWRVASPAEQHKFRYLFADRLVRFYGRQLAQTGGGDFVVSGSRPSAEGVIVTSRIIRSQGAPIIVDWRLGVTNGVYKIGDVAIDGVSMALAQVSDRTAYHARGRAVRDSARDNARRGLRKRHPGSRCSEAARDDPLAGLVPHMEPCPRGT